MKEDAKQIIRHLHKKLGKDELRVFLSLFGGMRITIPSMSDFEDLARDAEVMDAWRTKRQGTITEFCRRQAREQQCHPKTIQRTLNRILKKIA